MRDANDVTSDAPTAPTGHDPTEALPTETFDFLAPAEGPGEMGRLGGYRVLSVLGRGGMGVVFLAHDPRLDRQVALKVILPEFARRPNARERFAREARAAAQLHHDHVVPIYQVGEDRGVPFLAMPLLRGQPLDARLRSPEPVPLAEALRIAREVALGLQAAHEAGLVHRDVKPANVWLEEPAGRVKLLDFGLARQSGGENLTHSGMVLGTPAFMAPEQGRGEAVDARADLFSLGVVLYRLVAGELPFKGGDPMSVLVSIALDEPPPPDKVNPAVPAAVSALVMRLLRKKPGERPASAAEVVALLDEAARQKPRRRRWPYAAACLVLALVAPAAVYWPRGAGEAEAPDGAKVDDRVAERPEEKEQAAKAAQGAAGPSPFDRLRRADIPAKLLALAGGDKAPPELVGMLGSNEPDAKENASVFAISPDGSRVATINPLDRDSIRVFEVPTWKRVRSLPRWGEPWAGMMQFSPDGELLAYFSREDGKRGQLRLWRVADWRPVGTYDTGTATYIQAVFAFSPDGGHLALGAPDAPVQLYRLKPKVEAVPLPDPSPCKSLLFLDAKTLLFTTVNDNKMEEFHRLDVATGKRLADLPRTGKLMVHSLRLVPPGDRLVFGHPYFPALQLNDLRAGRQQELAEPDPPEMNGQSTRTPAVRPDGKALAALTSTGRVDLWDLQTLRPRRLFELPNYGRTHPAFTQAFAFAPDGRHLCLVHCVDPERKSPRVGPLCVFRLPGD